MHISLAFATLITVYYVPLVLCGDQCFNIDQVQFSNDGTGADYIPCEPSALTSTCCPLGWICLSNGLCEPLPGNRTQNHGGTSLYTGFCTDPLWRNDTVCPQVCNNNVTIAATSGNGIVACGSGNFCCYHGVKGQCCRTPSYVFSLGVATVVTTLTGQSPTSTTPTSTTPTTTTPTDTTSILRTNSASAVIVTTATSSTTSASTISSAAAKPSSPVATSTLKAGSKYYVGIGIGVGVAVGLVIFAGLLYLKRRRPKTISEGPLYVDGKNEMDAVVSEMKVIRVHERMTERRPIEMAG